MFTTYTIYNKDSAKIYIGHTANLNNRLKRHNGQLPNKQTSFTSKNKGKWILIYKKNFETRKQAINKERELKTYKGREFVKKFIKK